MKFLEQTDYLEYIMPKKQNSFYTGSLKDKHGPETMFFVEFLDRFFSFVMLQKQAKCYYQNVFLSQVIW